MNPIVVWLAQPELQPVHDLQRIGSSINEQESSLSSIRGAALTTATLPLAHLAFPGLSRIKDA